MSLVDTVYPALEEVRKRTSHLENVTFQKREDSYLFKTDGNIELERVVLPMADLLKSKSGAITGTLREVGSGGAILLFNFTAQPKAEDFANVLTNLLMSMEDAATSSVVGKGHTIQLARIPEESLVMADFIGNKPGDLWGLANNDSISNVDPMLPHSHKYAVAIAMNNVLNDLFVYGIQKDFIIYPSYDARDDEGIEEIKASLEWYGKTFGGLGVEIRDLGPLRSNNKIIGGTAIGFCDHEIPANVGLVPGQKIIATRPIGELAVLNEYLMRIMLEEDVSDLDELRNSILSIMLTPNVEAAKIICDYLPGMGEYIDPAKHISATRDMSGPGLRAIQELSEDSMCDVYIHDIRFHDEMIPEIEVRNVTSGTNGAILICVADGLHKEIFDRLEGVGYNPWVLGEVGAKNENPRIIMNPDLEKYRFLTMGKGFFKRYEFGGINL